MGQVDGVLGQFRASCGMSRAPAFLASLEKEFGDDRGGGDERSRPQEPKTRQEFYAGKAGRANQTARGEPARYTSRGDPPVDPTDPLGASGHRRARPTRAPTLP